MKRNMINRGAVMIDYLERLGNQNSYRAKFEALVCAIDNAKAEDDGWNAYPENVPKKTEWYHVVIFNSKTNKTCMEQDLFLLKGDYLIKPEFQGFCEDGRWDGEEKVIAWHSFPTIPENHKGGHNESSVIEQLNPGMGNTANIL